MDEVRDFHAWLKTKPADEEFDSENTKACCYAQFLIETGRAHEPMVMYASWIDRRIPERKSIPVIIQKVLPEQPCSAAQLGQRLFTFGEILENLEEELVE